METKWEMESKLKFSCKCLRDLIKISIVDTYLNLILEQNIFSKVHLTIFISAI